MRLATLDSLAARLSRMADGPADRNVEPDGRPFAALLDGEVPMQGGSDGPGETSDAERANERPDAEPSFPSPPMSPPLATVPFPAALPFLAALPRVAGDAAPPAPVDAVVVGVRSVVLDTSSVAVAVAVGRAGSDAAGPDIRIAEGETTERPPAILAPTARSERVEPVAQTGSNPSPPLPVSAAPRAETPAALRTVELPPLPATPVPRRVDLVMEPARLGTVRVSLVLAGGRAQLTVTASTEAGFAALRADGDLLLPILREVRGGEGGVQVVLQGESATGGQTQGQAHAWTHERAEAREGERAAGERRAPSEKRPAPEDPDADVI